MINALKVTQLKNAIKNYDTNYIKNLYLYNKDLYFELCKQVAIIQAFCNAQSKSHKEFDDTKLNFWKTIYYINLIECSLAENVYNAVELRFLPKVYLTIIDEINMDTNKLAYLKQHTPLWRTGTSFVIFSILTSCLAGALFAINKLNDHVQIENLIGYVYNFAMDVWSDQIKFNIFVNSMILLATTSIFCFVSTRDYTKEYFCNFGDWIGYKYNSFCETILSKRNQKNETAQSHM